MYMNEVLEVLKNRRSVRNFTDEMVPDEILEKILEAGTYAPTGSGRQSPVIVAVKDRETRDYLSELNAKVAGSSTDPFYGAPIFLVVLASGKSAVEDGSGVMNYLMLAAKACDVDSVWIAREKEIFESEEGKTLLAKWGLPEDMIGIGGVALGYNAGETPEAAPRKADYILTI